MNITLVYASASRTVHQLTLEVPDACSLGRALALSGWLSAFPEIQALPVGIWGQKASLETQLREGDRVELYRVLRVDPKVARRERFVGQGARSAGLFAQRRPGSKAGY